MNADLLRWITIGISAITTLAMDKYEDQQLVKLWAAKTQAILDRGPDATPTDEEWAEVLAFAAFEHARVQASPI
jgi:hypothetical protein